MHPTLRGAARRALPRLAAERAIVHERALRERLGVTALAREVSGRLGQDVIGGPFAGMRLDVDFEAHAASPVLKLTGLYELPLHGAIERLLGAAPRTIVNVGCAEGYYAVGLALRLPHAEIRAYDLAPTARRETSSLAHLNSVADRVRVGGRCRPANLDADLVICDIEGGEYDLLTSADLCGRATVLVETHDTIRPGVTERLRERFATTHTIEELTPKPLSTPPALAWMTRAQRALALDEMRDPGQRWLVMTPR